MNNRFSKRSFREVITKIYKIDETELSQLRNRVDVAIAIIITAIAIIVSRLWFLQIYRGGHYAELSMDNRIRMQRVAAPRGNILDSKGRIIISTRPSFNVVWIREDAPNPDVMVKNLSAVLRVDRADILARIRAGSGTPHYVPVLLAEDIDWQTLVTIENQRFDLPGIRIDPVPRRHYLFNDSLSHTIGYLGEISREELQKQREDIYQGGDQFGKTGIESLYEQELRGEKGKRFVEVDARGFERQLLGRQEPLPGNDIQLTIDMDLQIEAEQALAGQAGAVVAMEVNTGRLLILASSPQLKLQEFIGGISRKSWQEMLDNEMHPLLNKAIQGQYPPGSTYKIVTALAGLEEGVISEKTVFYCNGSLQFGNRKYRCWKKEGHGAVNLKQALAQSCDVFFYLVGQKTGVDKLAAYAMSMGLGQLTNLPMENEKPGLIPTSDWKLRKKKESWQEGETLVVAIGQSYVTTTPLQICQMTAVTVNGGVRYRPQYIERITNADGQVLSSFAPIIDGHAKGSEKSFNLIQEGLVAAVEGTHGTGKKAKMAEVTMGGKTGTAQVVRLKHYKDLPEDQVPYQYRDHAWFICFAPAEKPVIAVTVLIEHGAHGSSAAAPIAKKILDVYFSAKKEPDNAAN